jgi:anti-anti-sigma factor
MDFEIQKQGDICIFRVKGRFVTGLEPEYLHKKAEELKQLHQGKVLVDLSQMPHIGSVGIGFLVGIFSSVEANSGRCVLAGMQPRVREIFDNTRLSTVLPMVDDIAAGMAMLRGEGRSAG